jgi:hypothetical protein
MTVVAVGNPFDGITLFGPFQDETEALEWAEGTSGDWHIVHLEEVEE